jgi:decaprenyl-phosphate phosphoribosyltransferase
MRVRVAATRCLRFPLKIIRIGYRTVVRRGASRYCTNIGLIASEFAENAQLIRSFEAMKYLQAMRPKQWTKNLLVMVAPFAAGNVFHWAILSKILFAFIAFSFAASCNYIVNDLRDVERDRTNPAKSNRPIALGDLSVPRAWVLAFFCFAIAVFFTVLLPGAFAITLSIYFVLTLLYSYGLKHEPIVELLIVSFGFALRAIGGATATNTPSSQWFLVVATFGPLVIVTAKRIAEKQNESHIVVRPVIEQYTIEFLQLVLTVAIGITLTAYSLWAFSLTGSHPFAEISVITVTFALFRYILAVEKNSGESPEEVMYGDWYFLGAGFATALLLILSVYANN